MSAVLSEPPMPMVVVHEDDRDDARDSIAWDILMGGTVGGFDLATCLDCEANGDGYHKELASIIVGEEGVTNAEQRILTFVNLHDLAYRIVAKHIPESAIEARAYEYAESRRDEARRGF